MTHSLVVSLFHGRIRDTGLIVGFADLWLADLWLDEDFLSNIGHDFYIGHNVDASHITYATVCGIYNIEYGCASYCHWV